MFLREAFELFSRDRILRRKLPPEFGSRELYVSRFRRCNSGNLICRPSRQNFFCWRGSSFTPET